MSEELTKPIEMGAEERALVVGDLSKLDEVGRASLYNRVCNSLKLNPLTKPFAYITLNGKLTLYATKDCTEQLRKNYGISLRIVSRDFADDLYIVTAQATTPQGRIDESTGVVNLGKAAGEIRANLLMKAETKAKRRVTLSICGLGMLDETEVDSIPDAQPVTILDPTVSHERLLKTSIDVIDGFRKRFQACETMDALRKVAAELKDQPEYVRTALRKDYQEQSAAITELAKMSKEEYYASQSAKENSKSADDQALYEGYAADQF